MGLNNADKGVISRFISKYEWRPSKQEFLNVLTNVNDLLDDIAIIENYYTDTTQDEILKMTSNQIIEYSLRLGKHIDEEKRQNKYNYRLHPDLTHYPKLKNRDDFPYFYLSYEQLRASIMGLSDKVAKHIVDNKSISGIQLTMNESKILSKFMSDNYKPSKKEFTKKLYQIMDRMNYIDALEDQQYDYEELLKMSNTELLEKIVQSKKNDLLREPNLTEYPLIELEKSPYTHLSYIQFKELFPRLSDNGILIILYTKSFDDLSDSDKNVLKQTKMNYFPSRQQFLDTIWSLGLNIRAQEIKEKKSWWILTLFAF